CGVVALWLCGFVALRLCGFVALWLCGDPCAGYGETWGPGIGPPPAGCGGGGGGAGAQLEDIENASRTVVSPYAIIWLLLFAFAMFMRRRMFHSATANQ
ncbi:MAG: hypothetical protein ACPHS8_05155, partial [Candidatus Poseidoniaceae archaeon]